MAKFQTRICFPLTFDMRQELHKLSKESGFTFGEICRNGINLWIAAYEKGDIKKKVKPKAQPKPKAGKPAAKKEEKKPETKGPTVTPVATKPAVPAPTPQKK